MLRWATRVISSVLLCGMALAAEQPGLWLDVPFVKQEKNGCGAAVIAMVMQYWQRQHPVPSELPRPDQIQRALYARRGRGIYASDMERYLRQHGFQTFAIRGEWTDLWQHLEKGRPIIVALRSGRDDLHYVLVTGMEPEHGLVLQNDPAERKLVKRHRSDFESEWKATGNWTLLAVPEH